MMGWTNDLITNRINQELFQAEKYGAGKFIITLLVARVKGPKYEPDFRLIYAILVFMSVFVLVYTSTFGPIDWMEAEFPDEIKWFVVLVSASFNNVVSVLLATGINIISCELKGS